MELKIKQLIGWIIIFKIMNDPVREFAQTLDFNKSILTYFTNLMDWAYLVSFFMAFGSLSVLVYLIFHVVYPSRKNINIKRKKTVIAIAIFISSIFSTLLRYLLEEQLFYRISGKKNYWGDYDWSYYYFDNLYFAIIYAAIGIIFFFFQYAKYNERQKKNLELENKKAELSFLKSQVNPHFLFNNLNNLYSLVYHKSDKALKFVEKLSGLLRYSLYENEHLVPLEKELNYLDNLIDLESLRYDFDIFVNMDIEKGLEQIKVTPLLFVPFVENAFKHGVLHDAENPVTVSLKKEGKNLRLKVNNKIKHQNIDGTGGIGLVNVGKRLELIYGENHTFETDQSKGQFIVNLQLINVC